MKQIGNTVILKRGKTTNTQKLQSASRGKAEEDREQEEGGRERGVIVLWEKGGGGEEGVSELGNS